MWLDFHGDCDNIYRHSFKHGSISLKNVSPNDNPPINLATFEKIMPVSERVILQGTRVWLSDK